MRFQVKIKILTKTFKTNKKIINNLLYNKLDKIKYKVMV